MEQADSAVDAKATIRQGNRKKAPASKYDMVKVRVWLGDHHYVLSRYLISRMLTMTRIPHSKATKIALEVKKQLVDEGKQDVQQSEMEAVLFREMEARGFGEAHVACYRLVSRFMAARQPLVLLLCGAPWTGKSSIAQQLAGRLNLSNILSTAFVYDMLLAGGAEELHPTPLCARPDLSSDEAVLAEYQRECNVVQAALEGELNKAISEGKPLIVEGSHLDPGGLLEALEARGVILLPAASERLSLGGSSQDTTSPGLASGHSHDLLPAETSASTTAAGDTRSAEVLGTERPPLRPASTSALRHVSDASGTFKQALPALHTPLRPADQPIRRSGSLPHLQMQTSSPLPPTRSARRLALLSEEGLSLPPRIPTGMVMPTTPLPIPIPTEPIPTMPVMLTASQPHGATGGGSHPSGLVSHPSASQASGKYMRSPLSHVLPNAQLQPDEHPTDEHMTSVNPGSTSSTSSRQLQQQQQQQHFVGAAETDIASLSTEPAAAGDLVQHHQPPSEEIHCGSLLQRAASQQSDTQPAAGAAALGVPEQQLQPHRSTPSGRADEARSKSLPALILPVVLQVQRPMDHALIAADRGVCGDEPAAFNQSAAGGAPQVGTGKLSSLPVTILARDSTGSQPRSSMEKELHSAVSPKQVHDECYVLDVGERSSHKPAQPQPEFVGQTRDTSRVDVFHQHDAKVVPAAEAFSSGEHVAVPAAGSTPQATLRQASHAVQGAEGQQPGSALEGGGGDGVAGVREGVLAAGGVVPADQQLARARLIQDYLGSYELQGVPVVSVGYGAFKDTVDELHEYVLAAITTAMTWMERSA